MIRHTLFVTFSFAVVSALKPKASASSDVISYARKHRHAAASAQALSVASETPRDGFSVDGTATITQSTVSSTNARRHVFEVQSVCCVSEYC